MTKSDSVSVYRRFSAPLRGKIVGLTIGIGPKMVYDVKVTSRNDADHPYGSIVEVIGSDIYDTHRKQENGRIGFIGRKWKAKTL